MKIVSVHEAKTHLSRLLESVSAGDEVIISKSGKPVARLVPIASRESKVILGSDRGKVQMSRDFNKTPKDFGEYLK